MPGGLAERGVGWGLAARSEPAGAICGRVPIRTPIGVMPGGLAERGVGWGLAARSEASRARVYLPT
jgi:hypothetical protein